MHTASRTMRNGNEHKNGSGSHKPILVCCKASQGMRMWGHTKLISLHSPLYIHPSSSPTLPNNRPLFQCNKMLFDYLHTSCSTLSLQPYAPTIFYSHTGHLLKVNNKATLLPNILMNSITCIHVMSQTGFMAHIYRCTDKGTGITSSLYHWKHSIYTLRWVC